MKICCKNLFCVAFSFCCVFGSVFGLELSATVPVSQTSDTATNAKTNATNLARLPVFNHLYAIFLIIYGWVIFRCSSIAEILEFTKTMFGAYGWRGDGMNPSVTLLSMADVGTIQIAVFVIAVIASTPILSSLKAFAARTPKRERILSVAADVSLLVLFALSIVELTLGSYNPFIYFKF